MNRIREVRITQGMTQVELAKKAGIDQSTLSKYEREEKGMVIETVAKISRALGHSVEYLFPDLFK